MATFNTGKNIMFSGSTPGFFIGTAEVAKILKNCQAGASRGASTSISDMGRNKLYVCPR